VAKKYKWTNNKNYFLYTRNIANLSIRLTTDYNLFIINIRLNLHIIEFKEKYGNCVQATIFVHTYINYKTNDINLKKQLKYNEKVYLLFILYDGN